ncbi:hypothetical protein MTsDn5_08460 [Alteromonas gracilis]
MIVPKKMGPFEFMAYGFAAAQNSPCASIFKLMSTTTPHE